MCQFCIQHGEGKKWYLAMKNYSDELLHQKFSAEQKDIFDAPTRADAIVRMFGEVILPAITGVAKPKDENAPRRRARNSARTKSSRDARRAILGRCCPSKMSSK